MMPAASSTDFQAFKAACTRIQDGIGAKQASHDNGQGPLKAALEKLREDYDPLLDANKPTKNLSAITSYNIAAEALGKPALPRTANKKVVELIERVGKNPEAIEGALEALDKQAAKIQEKLSTTPSEQEAQPQAIPTQAASGQDAGWMAWMSGALWSVLEAVGKMIPSFSAVEVQDAKAQLEALQKAHEEKKT